MDEYRIETILPNGHITHRTVEGEKVTMIGFEDLHFFVARIGWWSWSVSFADTGRAIGQGRSKTSARRDAFMRLEAVKNYGETQIEQEQ